MKKLIYCVLVLLINLLLCCCVDKSDYQYDENYAYEKAWADSFGEIPENQSWDFYKSLLESKSETRATSGISYKSVSQPNDIDFSYWQNLLKSGENNSSIGTHSYSLISNGSFFVYPVWYAGWYEVYAKYNFELGVYYNNKYTKIFGGANNMNREENGTGYSLNPNFGAEVNIPKGNKFQFYIRYTLNNKRYTYISNSIDYDCSTLLYSNKIDNENQIMVIGFEDQPTGTELDFNDVILYVKGNTELPIPESKRFMCEDLGNIGDFDFNDAVFDIQPLGQGKAMVTIQACGGTLPITLYVCNEEIGELHEMFGVGTNVMVNTSGSNYNTIKKIINVTSDFNLTTFNDIKLKVQYNDNDTKYITYSQDGTAPCIIVVPISVQWAKETVFIRKAYPLFFRDNWFSTFNSQYLY